jgi:DNA-cytosine methyltransferase
MSHKKKSNSGTKMQYSVAELFCGCGGFSHGFWRTGHFRTVLGNDVKTHALRTFKVNHTHDGFEPAVIQNDIRTVSDKEILATLRAKGVTTLDCLLGGPPCQGFSQMRRTEGRRGSKIVRFGGYNKLDQDPRNDLVLRFLEIAAALNPKVIVIENVPQFLSHYHDGQPGGIAQQVEEVLREAGYAHVHCDILNSADYGVPQLRERAFIIASRLGPINLPIRTHRSPDMLPVNGERQWVTVREALSDLPPNPPLRDTLGGKRGCYVASPANPFAKLMRTSRTFPHNHITRDYQRRIIDIIQQMREGETWDEASERICNRFDAVVAKAVASGETEAAARKRLEAEGKIIPAFYKNYYWSAYTRLAWNRPALTITANANFLGSGRFTHPELNRGVTMREAARLQAFDDAFTFYTTDEPDKATENIGVGLDMIGEAVPPLLAQAIAETVAVHLRTAEIKP